MRFLGSVSYWLVALSLVSAILVSLDYTLSQSVLISLVFCPFAIALEYLMPKAEKALDKIYLSLAILVTITLLILVLHFFVWSRFTSSGYISSLKEVPPMLVNPVFLSLVLTALALGNYFWRGWLCRRLSSRPRTITFYSDRRSVSLDAGEIAYIESNDTEVRIVSFSGESFRNKTGITQWENLLGEGFLRIHRSYLVNTSGARLSSGDSVMVGQWELPISRKYKEKVHAVLGAT